MRTLGQVLRLTVDAHGEREALVSDRKRYRWNDILDHSLRAARALAALGVKRGDHVAILMGNHAAWVTTFFGAALIGAVTVPVNTRFKSAELAFCLSHAEVKVLLIEADFLGIDYLGFLRKVEPAIDSALPGKALPRLARLVTLGGKTPATALSWAEFCRLGEEAAPAGFEALCAAVTPNDDLLMQFTSGTTAYPKGVLLTHDNMLRNAHAVGSRMGVRAEDRYFNCRPFYHVAGTTLSLLVSLQFGACMVTLPTFEPGAALRMLAEEKCTLTSGNDTIFQMLMGHADFDPARLVLRGGWAASGPATMRKIIDVLGMRAVCAAYGLSEASPNVVFNDHRDPEELRVAGRALPHEGVEVRIADGERLLPAGSQGEIQVRGWNVMRGYYNNDEANAKAFTADGWLRTGDLGVLGADGRLSMVGRLKDVFRVGGENVAPAEVEEVLLAHAAVATAQVVGVPDARLGEVPAAFVTLKAGATASETELIAWCKARAANFRVPRYLEIVADFEAIGMTGSGKVQKNRLREHALRKWELA
ncbi:MAG: AMP-binding protein [Burkholderiales bacterium]|nr:AMP-binding protein [Burkholderiales bacterium]